MFTRDRHRAAGHFGLGGNQRDFDAMGDDPAAWLRQQIDNVQDRPHPDAPSSVETLAAYQAAFADRRRAQQNASGDSAKVEAIENTQQMFRRDARRLVNTQVHDRVRFMVETDTPYRERLVSFWSNHFTVSRQGNPLIIGSCLAFENEAIRSTLDGHFANMLAHVIGHPVMLMYLDNAQSVGPNSPMGQRRKLGLNENLAREVLELHTLGVDGGYDQDDVTELAKILTGWTVGNDRLRRLGAKPGAFTFVSMMHEPGTHRLLGKRYRNDGANQAIEALKDLALHPATARHVATKLARHFVADQPPKRAIEHLSNVYLETRGHLPSLHLALIELEEAWHGNSRKLKTPQELIVSALRGIDAPLPDQAVLGPLATMNHIPFNAPSPAGWPDLTSHWGSPNALKQRVEWGVAVGQRFSRSFDPSTAVDAMVDARHSANLRRALQRAASPAQAGGLLLASPAFQWR